MVGGRGKQVIAVARTCNLLFIILDVNKPLHHKQIIEKELEGVGFVWIKLRQISWSKKKRKVVFPSQTQSHWPIWGMTEIRASYERVQNK